MQIAKSTSSPSVVTVSLLCALSVLPLSIFLPSLPGISSDLHVDYGVMSLSLAGYAGLSAILELLMGPLSDRYGRRPIILLSLALFTIGSIGCALSSSIWSFLAFRLVQAAVTSSYPVSIAAVRDAFGKETAASKIGYASMAAALAPMLGPAVGGSLDGMFGWRAIFWVLTSAGAMLFVYCWINLEETNVDISRSAKDQFSAYPILLRSARFWSYAACLACSTGAFYAFLVGVPLTAKVLLNLSPAALGGYIGTITLGFMVGSFLSGRYSRRLSLPRTIVLGRFLACIGPLTSLGFWFFGASQAFWILAPCVLVGVGNGLSGPCANAGAVSVHPRLVGSASGLAGCMTIAGGFLFSSATGFVVTDHNAAYSPFGMMLLACLLSLLAAVTVYYLEARRSGQES
ncbi:MULTISPECIES: multidrug effflux MFS transporter [Paraburkholderia]|jgi:DHA1 family bicyclomycin/chloramphenicol resistance-like MFS transporter|uniref:Drug resistance transporter, Bcr/CflA subfamily n=1 Tax=Paraburkholderia phenazinium TaxID=60549 RepID=A0A1N6KX07_9BURK|nr:multidrug effflux MFS transporter [Paraburkholderia phenazinium]SIO61035.1 drug resistance transporter, Bcr/CflA subfamily [Paraburkholderia phenazinium]